MEYKMRVKEISNRQVGVLDLLSIEYSGTYAGAMCCSFDERVTTMLLEGARSRFEANHQQKLQVIKSPNTKLRVYFDNDAFLENHIVLPFWQCTATFKSKWNDDPDDDYYEMGSLLSVLWHQDELPWPLDCQDGIASLSITFGGSVVEMELADHLIKYLVELDWKKTAHKFAYDF
jgi:hypothetical protein